MLSENLLSHRKLALIIDSKQSTHNANLYTSNGQRIREVLESMNFNIPIPMSATTDIMKQVQEFCELINVGDLILFYFSGDCWTSNGKKYLIPSGNQVIEDEADLKVHATDAQRILERLTEKKQLYVTIMILDCCRPFSLNGGLISRRK